MTLFALVVVQIEVELSRSHGG